MFKKIAIAAALIASSSMAMAAEPHPFYAGVDVSSTKLDGLDRDVGFGGFVGYTINQNFAVEAGYHRLADVDTMVGTETVGVKLNQADVSLIGTMPLGNGFNVFGRVGYNRVDAKATYMNSSAKDNTSGGLYGIGAGYSFTPEIMGRFEVQKPTSDITKIVAGVSYHF